MNVIDLFDPYLLEQHIANGYVTCRFHPDYPLAILNYSDKCQYEQLWDEVTTQCRGLIYSTDTESEVFGEFGRIVARPFPKFFNYGQPGAAEIAMDEPVVVTDKADGSLGIIYPTPDGGWAVATRGSFVSEQAIKGTQMLEEMLATWQFIPMEDTTFLAEIIYPENRIVLDYGTDEKLVLLGGIRNETGLILGADKFAQHGHWYGEVVESFQYATLADALAAEPRPNAEGLVVRAGDRMVKIKQEDYIRLHKLVFGLSEKAVWEHLSTHDGDISGMLEGLPDEFHDWVKDKAASLLADHSLIDINAEEAFNNIVVRVGRDNRKDFAVLAARIPNLRPYLFMLLDGKDISDAIWKSLKPRGASPMVERSEAVA